jgi:membrane protease YdiL (CAAX protease family)
MTATDARPTEPVSVPETVNIRQLSRRAIVAVWAAAALPMAVLAWVVAPVLASRLDGGQALPRALIVCLTIGLVWQFALVVGLVWSEQRTLRWSTVREALWLRSPRSPRTGRVGGKTWWIVVPLLVATAAEELVPVLPHSVSRDLGMFFESTAGQHFMHGAWGWFGVLLVMMVFNTVLGEELLFRGYLLPRMNGAFGDRDWLANGMFFAAYHLHVPWMIPAIVFDTFILAYPVKRYRSAWIGIAVHSAQTVVFTIAAVSLVLS